MSREVIAVDIDEVLAASAEKFIDYTNQQWGMNLTVDDYHEHWAELWKTDHQETLRRAKQYNESNIIETVGHFEEAGIVLSGLARSYKLVIATARRRDMSEVTERWVDKHYGGIFSEIHYAGIWDTEEEGAAHFTKGELCERIGAHFLIDDQLKHCEAVADFGVRALLFGNYSWNQADNLASTVTRCNDWYEVADYFHERTR